MKAFLQDECSVFVKRTKEGSLVDCGLVLLWSVTVLVDFVAKLLEGRPLQALFVTVKSCSRQTNCVHFLGPYSSVKLSQVTEHALVRLVNDYDCVLSTGLTSQISLVEHTPWVIFACVFTVCFKTDVAVFVCFQKSFILKDDIDVIVSVLQEKESECCVDCALTLARWDNPNLGVLCFIVQVSKRRCRELKMVYFQFHLFEIPFD